MEYELIREIKNLCPNNQMRDISFQEVTTDDPVAYVRTLLHGRETELTPDSRPDGGVVIHTVCDGMMQTFTFTPV